MVMWYYYWLPNNATFYTWIRASRVIRIFCTMSVRDNWPITLPSILCLLQNIPVPNLDAFTTCDRTRNPYPVSICAVDCYYKFQHMVMLYDITADYMIMLLFLPGAGQTGWLGSSVQGRLVTSGSPHTPPFCACCKIFLCPIWIPAPHVTEQGFHIQSPTVQSTVIESFNLWFSWLYVLFYR